MISELVLFMLLAVGIGSANSPEKAAAIKPWSPPPVRVESVPSPRRGYVWVAGHWGSQEQQHPWVEGAWLRARPGYSYLQPVWVERDGHWYLEQGAWRRKGPAGAGAPKRKVEAQNTATRD